MNTLLICLILFISSLPAFICECMFGLCHAWPGVVFYLISVGAAFLHSSVFFFSLEELVLFNNKKKDTEVHLSGVFSYFRVWMDEEEWLTLLMV